MIPVPKRDWQVYAVLAGISVLIRLPFLGTFDLVSFDGTYYINQAKVLWSSQPQPGSFPLGYPFFISLFLPVVGDGVRAAQAVSLVAAIGALFVFYRLALRYLEREHAFLSAVYFAVTPLFVRLSMETFSESTYTFWMLLTLFFYLRDRDAAAGATGGVAAITRPEMLGIIGILFLMRLRTPRRALLMILPFFVVFSLNALKFYQSTGQLSVLPKSKFFGTSAQSWVERERTVDGSPVSAQHGESSQAVTTTPSGGQIVTSYSSKLPRELALLGHNVGFILLLMGAYGFIRRPSVLLVALIPLVVGPLFTVRTIDRYLLPYIPIVIMYAFIGVESVKNVGHRKVAALAIAVSAVLMLGLNSDHFSRPVDEGFTEMKEAGLYLRDYVQDGDVIADRKPYVAFYAGASYVEIPYGSYEGTIQDLIDQDVRFLSLHLPVLKQLRPIMASLLTDAAVAAGELRFKQVWGHEEGLILYQRVLDRDPLQWQQIDKVGRGFNTKPDWSPDGRWVVFSSTVGKQLDLFVVPASGGDRRLIVGGPHQEDQPDWSYDGRLIAFRSNRTGDWNVFTVEAETGEIRQVTSHPADDSAPSWTPDGSHIVFASERSGTKELWQVELQNGKLMRLTDGGPNDFPSVSPDGSRIAWTIPNRGLAVMDLATLERNVLPAPREVNYAPAWSPDGKFIAVTGRDWGSVDIYLVTADGAEHLLLTKNAVHGPDAAFDAQPSWSHDGTRLALISNKEGHNALYVLGGVEAYTDRLLYPQPLITFGPVDE
jgi:hypothetical protein